MTGWGELAWPEVPEAVSQHRLALLAFGAIEEHGPHLPLETDNLVADHLADRIARQAGLLRLPTIPYGQVWSLEGFAGSLSVSDETLIALVRDLARGLARNEIRGLVLLSAHLGNAAALKKASRELEQSATLPCLPLVYPGLADISEQVREAPRSHPGIMHADEIETSIMLHVDPDRVRMDRAQAEYPSYPEDFDVAPVRWDAVSDSGVFGDPTAATATKGAAVLDHVVSEAQRLIRAWSGRLV